MLTGVGFETPFSLDSAQNVVLESRRKINRAFFEADKCFSGLHDLTQLIKFLGLGEL
jgi:hypothetical protein